MVMKCSLSSRASSCMFFLFVYVWLIQWLFLKTFRTVLFDQQKAGKRTIKMHSQYYSSFQLLQWPSISRTIAVLMNVDSCVFSHTNYQYCFFFVSHFLLRYSAFTVQSLCDTIINEIYLWLMRRVCVCVCVCVCECVCVCVCVRARACERGN